MTTATAPSPAHHRLTPSQVDHYRSEGYLIYNQPVFGQEKFNGLKSCFEGILAALPANERPEAMDVPHFLHPELLQWALSDEVLNLVEPIIGPDIALFSTHFICKPTGNGKRVPWHEDSAYWKGQITPMDVCTVWLAIDPSLKTNGCMMVIPRTHNTGNKGFSDYEDVDTKKNVFSLEILESQREDARKVHLELQPNQCSLHDARIMHGSEANTSSIRRCGWTMRFISTRSRFNVETHGDVHTIYLARGKDHAGNTYADPTKSYGNLMAQRALRFKNSH